STLSLLFRRHSASCSDLPDLWAGTSTPTSSRSCSLRPMSVVAKESCQESQSEILALDEYGEYSSKCHEAFLAAIHGVSYHQHPDDNSPGGSRTETQGRV